MPIARLYSNVTDAHAAIADLKQAEFRDGDIRLITSDAGYVSPESLIRLDVAPDHANTYAASVRAGAVLVLVTPLLFTAAIAEEILDAPRPGDTVPTKSTHASDVYNDSAPLSSALGLPLLTKHQRSRTHLSKRQTSTTKLSTNATPFSSLLHLPTLTGKQRSTTKLSHNPAPFSSLLHLPTLTRKQRSTTKLVDSPAPLSATLHAPVLERED